MSTGEPDIEGPSPLPSPVAASLSLAANGLHSTFSAEMHEVTPETTFGDVPTPSAPAVIAQAEPAKMFKPEVASTICYRLALIVHAFTAGRPE